MKLLVFIPAYNEEATIGDVIKSVQNIFQSKYIKEIFDQTEILVINDNSTDSTVAVSEQAGAIVYSLYGESKGVGRVIKKGLVKILELKPDVAVGIDADGQFDSNDIPRLIMPIVDKKADMVTGTKFTDKSNPPLGLSKSKLYGNYLVRWIVNSILGTKFTDVSCGFRAYGKEALLNMNIFGDRTYVQEAFIDFYNKGLAITEIPIVAKYFKERKSRVFRFGGGILSYAMRSWFILMRAVRDYQALKFFGTIALFCFLAAVPFGFGLLIHYLLTDAFSPYIFLGFISGGLLVLGLILSVIALLADMLARMRGNQERILYTLRKNSWERP